MIKVFAVPISEDLTEFTQFLWRHEIPHRVIETHENTQELWVAPTVSAEKIEQLYGLWKQGKDLAQIEVVQHSNNRQAEPGFAAIAKMAWFSSLLIFTSGMLSFLISFGENFDLLRYLTITDLLLSNGHIYSTGILTTLTSFELWRFISPIFLHFGAAHIIFNVLWVWVVGTKIEIIQGRWTMIGLVLFSGIVSNLAQYWETGPMFGGLSGVVFALLGYAWLWDKLNHQNKIGIPPAMMGFMLFWLALGYTGVLTSLGFGSIANTAHLIGLLAGLLFVPINKFFVTIFAKHR